MKKEFQAVFQLSKTEIFEVSYYTLSSNAHPYFTTQAARFCRNKRDFSTGGQAQNDVCKHHLTALHFFRKWDKLHLHDMTEEEYTAMRADLEKLSTVYNYIFEELDESKRPYNPGFSFYRLAEWTKQPPKSGRKS